LQGKCYSTQYSEYKHLLEKGESVVLLAKRNKDEFVLSKLKTFDEWKAIIEKKQKLKESAR
jgi:DNA polymerase-3 subunit alpha